MGTPVNPAKAGISSCLKSAPERGGGAFAPSSEWWRALFVGEAQADLSAEALAKDEEGMAEMSKVFRETGSELYMGAGGREHD